MPRAIVFNGDDTWELREVPKPELRAGCAVLRVEAVGICHSGPWSGLATVSPGSPGLRVPRT